MSNEITFYDLIMETEILPLHLKFAFFVLKEYKNKDTVFFEDFLKKYKCSTDHKAILKDLRVLDYGENFYLSPNSEDKKLNKVYFDLIICGKSFTFVTPDRVKNVKAKTLDNKNRKNVYEIFDFWKTTMGDSRKKLTPNREKVISEALAIYSFEECKNAIIGCSKSLHHMGFDNFTGLPNDKKYNDILNIFVFKRGSNFEKLIEKKDLPSLEDQIEKLKPKKTKMEKRKDARGSMEYL